MGALTFFLTIATGAAHKSLGPTWASDSISYNGDASLARYTAHAAALWAGSSRLNIYPGAGDIQVVSGPLRPPVTHAHQAAQANLTFYGTHISACEVRVDLDNFNALSLLGRQNVITHEIGHCLGLDHSYSPGIMLDPLLYSFSNDDAAGIAALYPRLQAAPAAAAAPAEPTPAPAKAGQSRAANAVSGGGAASPPRQQGGVLAASGAEHPAGAEPVLAPRPFAGDLPIGWTYVVWSGPESDPANCACTAIVRSDNEVWTRWYDGSTFVNTIVRLQPGVSYWMLNEDR